MNNEELTQEQLSEFTKSIEEQKPIPLKIQLSEDGFKFIINTLMILDKIKYKSDHNIEIVSKNSTLSRFEGRIILSDGSSRIINLREEK